MVNEEMIKAIEKMIEETDAEYEEAILNSMDFKI